VYHRYPSDVRFVEREYVDRSYLLERKRMKELGNKGYMNEGG